MNKTRGVELEIRKDDGSTIMVVQKQGNTRFCGSTRRAGEQRQPLPFLRVN